MQTPVIGVISGVSIMRSLLYLLTIFCLPSMVIAEPLTVGVPTVLSGDLAGLGGNLEKTVETYRRHYQRHDIRYLFEDSKLGSLDGLNAHRALIEARGVDLMIGGTTSNGLLASLGLIEKSKTVVLRPLTGGRSTDDAGDFVFRIGNSDIVNGSAQAERFIGEGVRRLVILSEETEYSEDISGALVSRFRGLGGTIVRSAAFLPGTTDFRSEIARLSSEKPDAVFVSTQTGLAFGLFMRQLRATGATVAVHTNFVAAVNADARTAAGDAIRGVEYLAPSYDRDGTAWKRFLEFYRTDHGVDPLIPFHSAGTVDGLTLLERYLDEAGGYSRDGFRRWLTQKAGTIHGLMGTYELDAKGNSGLGFDPARVD